ncbi:MAG: YceI family protein [Pseudomonadales bacterium]|nr:YceI family protein [Pseudomonadales bacterium]
MNNKAINTLSSKTALFVVALVAMLMQSQAMAVDTYKLDTRGAHAFIQFKIKHLGYSWLYGRFDKFDGTLELDESAPEKSKITVTVDTTSLNSNHAERDKHLKGKDFLNVDKYPSATFVSTGINLTGETAAVLKGKLTLHGVTKDIEVPISHVGGGKDPWGGYRHGFTGTVTLALKDFGIDYNLGPASTHVDMLLDLEFIKQ